MATISDVDGRVKVGNTGWLPWWAVVEALACNAPTTEARDLEPLLGGRVPYITLGLGRGVRSDEREGRVIV